MSTYGVAYCGGIVDCNGYIAPSSGNIADNSGRKADNSDFDIDNCDNHTDATAFIYEYTDDNKTNIHVLKTTCSPKMKCKYYGNGKVISNNDKIWAKEIRDSDGKLTKTILSNYNSFINNKNLGIGTYENVMSYKEFEEFAHGGGSYGIDFAFINDAGTNDVPSATTIAMFNGCTTLTECDLPCEMRAISQDTFKGCTNLKRYTTHPEFIMEIGTSAFEDCTSMEELLIGRYAELSSGGYQFKGCTNATAITWDGLGYGEEHCKVKTIPNGMFSGCTSLSATNIVNDTLKYLYIPSGVTSIGPYAFSDCNSFSGIQLNGVTEIGNYAFSGMNGTLSISGISKVNEFGEYSFVRLGDASSSAITTLDDQIYAQNIAKYSFANRTIQVKKTNEIFSLKSTNICEGAFLNVIFNSGLTISGQSDIDEDAFQSVEVKGNLIVSASTSNGISASTTSFQYSKISGTTRIKNLTCNYSNTFERSTFGGYVGISSSTFGNYAFEYSTFNDDVEIKSSTFGVSAFQGCTFNYELDVTADTISLGCFSDAKISGNFSLYGVEIINRSAFNSTKFKDNTRLDLSSVESIGERSFENCSGLTNVTIGDYATSIGESAFSGCSDLTSCTIGNSVTSIGVSAFTNCSGLTSIEIPDRVTSISDYTFRGCSDLTSCTIGNSVTSIGNYAFQNCSDLTSCTIGDGVTSIGTFAFYQCTSLKSIEIPNGVINGLAFANCISLTSVTIGNGVTSIGVGSFGSCSGLTSIDIPDSVTTIGQNAFIECSGLTSVTVRATTPPTLGDRAFYNNASGRKIYVPSESVETYKTASGWSDYESDIEPI